MNPNDRVRVIDGLPDHPGKEGSVVQVVSYTEIEGLVEYLREHGDNGADTAFVAVQLDDPGVPPVTDEELFMAELFGGVPAELTNILREHRTAVVFDDGMLELVTT